MTDAQKKALFNSYKRYATSPLYLGPCSAVVVREMNEGGYVHYHDHPARLTKKGLRVLAELEAGDAN